MRKVTNKRLSTHNTGEGILPAVVTEGWAIREYYGGQDNDEKQRQCVDAFSYVCEWCIMQWIRSSQCAPWNWWHSDILYSWPVSLSSTWSLHNLLFPLPISVKEICFLDARHSLCLGRKDQAGVETLITTQISKSTDSSWMVVLETTQDCLGWKMMSLIWTSWKWMPLRYLKSKSKSWTYGTCLFGVFFLIKNGKS